VTAARYTVYRYIVLRYSDIMDDTANPLVPPTPEAANDEPAPSGERRVLSPLAKVACVTSGVVGVGATAAIIAALLSVSGSTSSGGYGA